MPRGAVAAYAVGATPVALRGVLPTETFPPGLLLMAAGVAWLSITLIRHRPLPAWGQSGPPPEPQACYGPRRRRAAEY